ncbi:cupin domain-containing protein [Sphingopyxis sp. P1IMeth2]|uniref:cupin domain-containing protein n=1 Tax=Sphingopyxis sp. P1IMeth2 TaxID=1892848 RepID=UPI0016445AF2|nr:cupin domain-containing protein [Sphingopyxis sp. P1IMeth2]
MIYRSANPTGFSTGRRALVRSGTQAFPSSNCSRLTSRTRIRTHRHWGGEEMLVLEDIFEDEHKIYPAGSWIRSPHGSEHNPFGRAR